MYLAQDIQATGEGETIAFQPLRIVHVFRSPVGGLFRHVCNLVQAQAQMGHQIGIVCDASTGGATADARLKELSRFCALGTLKRGLRLRRRWSARGN